jgi:hypothetical protein
MPKQTTAGMLGGLVNLMKVTAFWALALSAVAPSISHADEWVYGNVILIEDMGQTWTPINQLLVQLGNKTNSTGGPIPSACTERFRIVDSQEGVDAAIRKSFMTILLTARLSGDRVRLLVNPSNAPSGFCTVKAVAIGEV